MVDLAHIEAAPDVLRTRIRNRASELKDRADGLSGAGKPVDCTERMNIKRWMRGWQARFSSFGVQVIVADVGQSVIFVDAAERTIALAPSLRVPAANKMLKRIHEWWQCREDAVEEQRCFLVSH